MGSKPLLFDTDGTSPNYPARTPLSYIATKLKSRKQDSAMPKAKAIPPFYDESSVPLMLTDQLELFGSTYHPSPLLANEILPSKSKNATSPPIIIPSKSKNVTSSLTTIERPQALDLKHARVSLSPYPQAASKRAQSRAGSRVSDRATSEPLTELSESTNSGSDSDSESTASTLSESAKIPKPPGESGRPGSGGYNLENAVGWNHQIFTKFKNFTYKLIDEHLDTTKCASAQNQTNVTIVRKKVMDAFPDLENYQNFWPIADMIMMRLKYTSSRARRHELEVSAGKVKRGKSSVAQK